MRTTNTLGACCFALVLRDQPALIFHLPIYFCNVFFFFFHETAERAGVKGIGQKGGSRLLEKFGTLEGVFAGLADVGNMGVRGSKGLQALLR